jgi:hypothetical protein
MDIMPRPPPPPPSENPLSTPSPSLLSSSLPTCTAARRNSPLDRGWSSIVLACTDYHEEEERRTKKNEKEDEDEDEDDQLTALSPSVHPSIHPSKQASGWQWGYFGWGRRAGRGSCAGWPGRTSGCAGGPDAA